MSSPKVFISSTCYDLSVIRSQLRSFVINLGYEPIMSDYGDVLYDPRSHTHTSCIKEVENSDMLILVIGTRFGGAAIPKSIDEIDIESLKMMSERTAIFEDGNKLSITQLEVLKAIEMGIPIFTFIDNSIYHSHGLYEKNKGKVFIDEISFPSVDKPETAKYIFEFINFLRLRSENNSITPFSRLKKSRPCVKENSVYS